MDKPRTLIMEGGVIRIPDAARTLWDDLPPFKRIRRRVLSPLYTYPDHAPRFLRRWLHPLELHVVICGYHRSGTTLMQAMMSAAYPGARVFDEEVGAWRAATYAWRNHRLLISKAPQDVCRIPQIRNLYAGKSARVHFVLMTRDPRDVLTSKQPAFPDYCQHIDDWRVLHTLAMHHRNDSDVTHVTYERLISDTAEVQRQIEAVVGEPGVRPFTEFHEHLSPTFAVRTLNSVRPVERSKVGRWARAEHAERMREVLREVPGFPQIVVDLGYEPDTGWVDRWERGLAERGGAEHG